MPAWVVTYTSMVTEAETAEEAIATEGCGGGHWQAHRVAPPEAMQAHAEVSPGDAELPIATATIGPVEATVYQHRDAQDRPLPVIVVEVDHPEHLEVRIHRNTGEAS